MNWTTVQGKWTEIQGAVKAKWGKLTDDDLKLVGGKFDELVGRLQQRYGHTRDRAEHEIDDFVRGIPANPEKKPEPRA